MFLSGHRTKTAFTGFKSLHTFNSGNPPDKGPVPPFRAWNDNALQGGNSVSRQVEKPADVLLLPLMGGLRFKTGNQENWVENGHLLIASLGPGMSYEILNPYEKDWISYLEIEIETPDASAPSSVLNRPVNTIEINTLHPLFSSGQAGAFFGIYDGGKEDTIHTPDDLFIFVIEGAIEVDYKLLEARDGVAISRPGEIEFEVLSDRAMLLIFELRAPFTA